MNIIDGKQLSKKYLDSLKEKFENINCKIALLYFKSNSATNVYIKNIKRVAKELNVEVIESAFETDIEQNKVIDEILKLNDDESVNSIFLSSDVPSHINFDEVCKHIDYKKDVDCATPHNIGLFYMGCGIVAPCTANSVINIIKMQFGNEYIQSKNCVVIGRNNVVGKPIATLMLNNDATVTVCHSKTIDLKKHTKNCDILIVAVGIPNFIKKDMLNENSVVIDVGTNYNEEGKLCGDVDFEDVKDYVSAITPVPGGIGQMTIAMFFTNCINLLNEYVNN